MKKRLPKFKNAESEAIFWETHDITEYVEPDAFAVVRPNAGKTFHVKDPAPGMVAPRSRKILFTMRLEYDILNKIKQLARQKNVKYQQLIRAWIEGQYDRESKLPK